MQEIAENVFIETTYAGVTLGVISRPHGLILIDAPFRNEDVRSWRSALLNLSGGVDRMLVNLDTHVDRTLGSRAMDCTVVGHEKSIEVYRNRPLTFKPQSLESGAEYELSEGLGNTRWAPPEITFTDRLHIHWDGSELILEDRPGPAAGAIWANLPAQRILFLGDAVIVNQPSFLAYANIPAWIDTLKTLLTPAYRDYLLIGGRNGLITHQEVRHQVQHLEKVQRQLNALSEKNAPPEKTEGLISGLLDTIKFPIEYKSLYRQRLRFGLYNYYLAHYLPESTEPSAE